MPLAAQYPRLAEPDDIVRLTTGYRVHNVWPPTGTTVVPVAHPEKWVVVYGEPTTGSDGDWWTTTLSEIALEVNSTVAAVLLALGRTFTGPIAPFVGAVGKWPVIYEQGKGDLMRWIASTVRGSLAGIEQFQFGINWGNPGSDPDLDDAQLLDFATDLLNTVQSQLATSQGGITPISLLGPSVKFEEVGAVMKTQTSATNKDGTGGNLEQGGETQWVAYPTASRPTGGASSITLPFEVALAVTLHSDHRGPSGRGRLYLPPLAVGALQEGGKFTTATAQTFGKFIGGVFTAMLTATSHVPVVVSRRRLILNEIKAITVGTIPDSQRRRRRSQDEAPVSAWTKP